MERSTRVFSATVVVFMLLLITITEEMGPKVAEARTCESASHRFKGICVSDRNCASVCQTERFYGGNCRGFRQRCMCTRPCLEGEKN